MREHKRIGRPRVDGQPQGGRDGVLQVEMLTALVENIPGFQTMRWRNKVREAFTGTAEVEHIEEDFWGALNDFRYMPDGFVIDREDMRVDLFEVEITSLLTRTKLQAYAEFLTIMDYYGIELCLYSVNQHGHINQVHLLPHYVEALKFRMSQPSPSKDDVSQ
jgi:hypothetical protein